MTPVRSTLHRILRFLPSYGGIGLIAVVVLAAGSVFYHYVEGWNWLDSTYFCFVTLATVGYGDFAPKTDLGKMFTMVYVLVGLGILGAFANAVFTRFSERMHERQAERAEAKKL